MTITDTIPPKRIIIVDDNADHLLVCKLILQRRGYEVLTLNNCDDLFTNLHLFNPRLIFMDHDMPGMSGMEATRLIKADEKWRHVSVIYFSSRVDIKQLADMAGADDWLSKPFRTEDLVRLAGNHV